LMSTQDFANFELEFEWKIGTGGNGGVYYRDRPESRKKNGAVLEYAIHDDQNKSLPSQQCSGSLWNLTSTYGNAGSLSVLRGTDEWNQGIIQANGRRLTHWLNGVKSADIRVGSTAWKQAIQKSKKSEPPGFGQQETGRIVLQQHTGPVSFRNLRIRPLDNRSDNQESSKNDSNVANQNQNEAQPRSDVSKKRRTSKEQIAGRRSFESRQKLVQKYGGHSASEDAVSLAMEWIAKHQLENGSWSFDHQVGLNPDERSSPNPGEYKNSPNAATAMVLLVFLGAGQTHREGDYKKVVEKGLAFLLANGKPTESGLSYLEEEGNMYSHGLVSIALCEAYAMSKDRRLAPAAQGVTQYILSCQDPLGGGWRYKPKQPGDTSVTGWQIMALNAAVMCGIDINEAALNQARRFLNSVATENGAFYVYLPSTTAKKKSMTAIGLLSQLHLGWNENNEALINGVDWLAEQGPDFRNWEPGESVAEDAKTKFTCDMYSNYYATQMIHQVGGEAWETWNPKMRDFLVATQATEGPAQGSWCFIGTSGNVGNAYSRAGGRLYTTALSALTLQTYYRYLPLYD